jgi:hypothetical protein
MLRFSLLTLATAALWAQPAAQKGPVPPPDVDKALRARINEFCELHKQGKFRQAEQMVADDTKDYFYNAGKPHYLSYEIQSITYNQDFTKATAIVMCEQVLPALGFQSQSVKMLTPFNWKIENGQWMWYLSRDALLFTPFGKLSDSPHTEGTSTQPAPAAPPGPPVIPTSVEQFFSMIKADKTALSLKPGASDQVVIANGTPGLVSLVIVQQVPGVEAKLDSVDIPSRGKAVLAVTAGTGAVSGVIRLQVKPIGPRISIQVSVE